MAEIVFGLALVPFLPDSDNADGGKLTCNRSLPAKVSFFYVLFYDELFFG